MRISAELGREFPNQSEGTKEAKENIVRDIKSFISALYNVSQVCMVKRSKSGNVALSLCPSRPHALLLVTRSSCCCGSFRVHTRCPYSGDTVVRSRTALETVFHPETQFIKICEIHEVPYFIFYEVVSSLDAHLMVALSEMTLVLLNVCIYLRPIFGSL